MNIVIQTTSESDLLTALNEMNNIFKQYNLKISAAKTRALVYYKKNIPTINLILGNK